LERHAARGITTRTRNGALQRVGKNAYACGMFTAARPKGYLRPFFQLTNLTNTHYEEINNVVMPGRTVIGGLEIAYPAKS